MRILSTSLLLILYPGLLWSQLNSELKSPSGTKSPSPANTINFNYTGSIDSWTVPAGITSITVVAAGSRGATADNGSGLGYGGAGSTMQGTFSVVPGEIIRIAVGGQGGRISNTSTIGAGGGGGSFVWHDNNTTEPMIAAGGGGGGFINGSSPVTGINATITTTGANASSGANGGSSGSGGGASSSYGGGGGAGWKSDGSSNGAPGNDGGKSRASNFAGGQGYTGYGYNGGFGGGAGSTHGGGGGGGYSGGGGANNSAGSGGGGGSYNGGTNQSNTAGNNYGLGYAQISYTVATNVAATSNLSTFVAYSGNASLDQIVSVSGCQLSGNITVTAPENFEISLTSGSNYSSSLSLTPSSNTVQITSVYVRMKSSAVGNPSGNLTAASAGASTVEVSLSGSVYNTTPVQASAISISSRTTTGATISWTNGNGTRHAVFIKTGSTGQAAPSNYITYSANTTYGSGTQIGSSGWYCIYNGAGTTVTASGLTNNTMYIVMAIDYIGANGSELYNTNTASSNPEYFTSDVLLSYSYSGSIQTWTVPAGITSCKVIAAGSAGTTSDNGTGYYGYGGAGSTMQGDFTVVPGEIIQIAVGGQGSRIATTSTLGAGGGGGSFVWHSNSTTEPMIAAGGGGGGYVNGTSAVSGLGATNTTTGASSSCGAAGGTSGNGAGASSSYGGGGGAGWKSNGTSNGAPGNDGGKSLASNFAGGQGYAGYGYNGGFGGGAGSTHGGGGGGGYSGGGGGYNSCSSGGGGGSYNAGTNQVNTAANNNSTGYIQIIYSPETSIAATGTNGTYESYQGNPSLNQIVNVSGCQLTGNISLTITDPFEMSLTSGSGYSSALSLSPTTGTVQVTPVYVRMKETAVGTPTGTLSLSSPRATSLQVSLTGTVFNASPIQASQVNVTTKNMTTATLGWTNGNGSRRAVFMKATNTLATPSPVNSTTYTGNTVFGSGTQIGSTGWYCIYNGTGSIVSVTGLTQNTTYSVMVNDYIGPNGAEAYNLNSASMNPNYFTTLAILSYSYSGSIQSWTVPAGVTSCNVVAAGSVGTTSDNGTGYYGYGGAGSTMQGDFTVVPGEIIQIAVGGQGSKIATTSTLGAGGGGGSFVWHSNSTTEPMIAAGGGGGGYVNGTSAVSGLGATNTTTGASSSCGAAGGTSGNGAGASSSYGGGGGAGWKSNGTSNGAPGNDGGKSRAGNFAGGQGYAGYGYNGGFGGGAGSTHGGGGGGGYSGGGGGYNSCSSGGGGGSYNSGTNQVNIAANNNSTGYVTIVYDPTGTNISTTGSLSQFTACSGSASTAQSFTVQGILLSDDIIVQAPSGFEISLTQGSNYTTSLTLIESGGTVAITTIYTRLSSSATGSPAGNISIASLSAQTRYLTVSGSVSEPANGGTATAVSNTICSGENAIISLSGYSGSIQWEQSENGSTGWVNVSGGTGANSNSFTSTPLNSIVYYRAKLSSGSCSTSYSNSVEISILNNWIGSSTGLWETPGNWCGGVPTTSTDVSIPDGVVVSISSNIASPAQCKDLLIETGAALIILPGKALTVNGNFVNSEGADGLEIQSDSTGSGSLIHSTSNVAATQYRYISGNSDLTAMSYHLVSVPLTPATESLSEIFSGSYLYNFNVASSSWTAMGTSTISPLDETRGYMIYTPFTGITYSFTGNMNAGTFSTLINYEGDGYNLVPNPYPSAIDWDASSGWTKSNVYNAIYMWPSEAANYASYVDGVSVNGGSRYIPAGQAFFVKASGSAPVLSMNNAVRVHNTQSFFKTEETLNDLLRIKASANGLNDETVVRFSSAATTSIDEESDAWKMTGLENAPQLYTITSDNDFLSINTLPYKKEAYTVPLAFSLNQTAKARLEFSGIESFDPSISLSLRDLKENRTISLRAKSSYDFTFSPGDDKDRFELIFGETLGINDKKETLHSIWFANESMYIQLPEKSGSRATVELFNATGQLVYYKKIILSDLNTLNLNLAGPIIGRVTTSDQVITTKTIIIR